MEKTFSAFNSVSPPDLADPLLGFRFSVYFLGAGPVGAAHPLDFRFMRVSGISARLEEDPTDPASVKTVYDNLVLERGMPTFSTLRMEIMQSLTQSRRIARSVLVSLLDENSLPLNSWLFTEAYPVSWSLSPFDANLNEVVIERIELKHSGFRPFSL